MPEPDPHDDLAALVRDPAPLAPVPDELVDRVIRNVGVADAGTADTGSTTRASGRPLSGAPPAPPTHFGPYRVVRALDRGGMGVVYVAQDPALARELAIKTLSADLAARPDARELFLREAQMMATVDHENVVPVYAFGTEGDLPYLVMPLLAGESLKQRLAYGPLEWVEVIRIGREIAAGLAAAHARGE
jgi:serine/threonine protein kinase